MSRSDVSAGFGTQEDRVRVVNSVLPRVMKAFAAIEDAGAVIVVVDREDLLGDMLQLANNPSSKDRFFVALAQAEDLVKTIGPMVAETIEAGLRTHAVSLDPPLLLCIAGNGSTLAPLMMDDAGALHWGYPNESKVLGSN